MANVATTYPEIAKTARAYGRIDANAANAKAKAVEAYRAAGAESDAMKTAFLTGYLMGTLGLTGKGADDKARAIMAKKGFGAKARADARRTENQESAYAAARQALKRVRDAAGVKPADKRGATSNPGKGKDAQTDKAKATPAKATPTDKTPVAVGEKDAAAHVMAYVNKNANCFKGKTGMALKRAVAAHHKAITEPAH